MSFFRPRLTRPTAANLGRDDFSTGEKLRARLAALSDKVQGARHLASLPLSPTGAGGPRWEMPHFSHTGPQASDDSPRMAFLSGFDVGDLRGTHSLLRFVEHLVDFPDAGAGLHLSFFPLVDALGVWQGLKDRQLASCPWHRDVAPEIALLENEARLRRFHGFVRIESAAPGVEAIVIRTRRIGSPLLSPTSVPIISPDDTELLDAQFETEVSADVFPDGPLSVEGSVATYPFEITLALPLSWAESTHRVAVHTILRRLIRRYRGLQAYGQHL